MKKLILILTFLILPALCFSGSIQDKHRAVIARKNAGGASCATLYHSATTAVEGLSVGYAATDTYRGQYGVDNTGAQICKVVFTVYAIGGDVSGITYQAEIFALGSSFEFTPGSPLGVSDTVTGPGTGAHTFTFASPVTLTGGTSDRYAFVMTRTDHGNNTTNYITISNRTTDGDSSYFAMMYWTNLGAYTGYDASSDIIYEAYTP